MADQQSTLFFYQSRGHYQVDKNLSHPLYFGYLIRVDDIGKHYQFNEAGHITVKPIVSRDLVTIGQGLEPYEEINTRQFDGLMARWILPPNQ